MKIDMLSSWSEFVCDNVFCIQMVVHILALSIREIYPIAARSALSVFWDTFQTTWKIYELISWQTSLHPLLLYSNWWTLHHSDANTRRRTVRLTYISLMLIWTYTQYIIGLISFFHLHNNELEKFLWFQDYQGSCNKIHPFSICLSVCLPFHLSIFLSI